jgi:hypothetical protein
MQQLMGDTRDKRVDAMPPTTLADPKRSLIASRSRREIAQIHCIARSLVPNPPSLLAGMRVVRWGHHSVLSIQDFTSA